MSKKDREVIDMRNYEIDRKVEEAIANAPGGEELLLKMRELEEREVKSCKNCGNRRMDMALDPYCAAPGIKMKNPYGLALLRGPLKECLIEGNLTLWEKDLRSQG